MIYYGFICIKRDQIEKHPNYYFTFDVDFPFPKIVFWSYYDKKKSANLYKHPVNGVSMQAIEDKTERSK